MTRDSRVFAGLTVEELLAFHRATFGAARMEAGEAPKAIAREGLQRSATFTFSRAEGDGEPNDGLTLEGYAAVFNSPTRIDSWEGTFDETIAPGAFKKTLRETTPVLQFAHGHHPLIGSIPLGVLKRAEEDEHGVFVSARMTDNWLIQPVRDAIADGAVNGMSYRFAVIRDEWRDNTGKLMNNPDEILEILWVGEDHDRGPLQRTVKELRCWELGPVVFPAYAATEVSVRSQELARALADPQIRRDVARAALLTPPATEPEQRPTAPPEGHPAARDDAPPTDGHPSQQRTAPQPDSVTERARRARELATRLKGIPA